MVTKKKTTKKKVDKDAVFEKKIEKYIEKKIKGCFEGDKCFTKGKSSCKSTCGGGSGIYCFGFIGAVVYYISTATGFWMGVWGVLKALVWPAFLVFEFLKMFKL